MKQSRLLHMLFLGAAVLASGCGRKVSEEIDFGGFKDSTYTNQYFGLSVTLPSEWSIQDQEMRRQLMDRGGELVAGDDKNLKAVVKASEMQTVNLFCAFEHPLGAPVLYNPGIMCMAERVRQLPGIKRGKDYLFHAKRLLESGQLKVSFAADILTEQIGGRDFDMMKLEMPIADMTVRQKYYAGIMNGYALTFIMSFTTTEEEASMQRVLDSVTFK